MERTLASWCALGVLVAVLAACGAEPPSRGRRELIPVRCEAVEAEADAVLCRPVVPPKGRGARGRDARLLLGRFGFLTGLHLGGAISSSGSLSASHSLNVFGKVMNTALSVSYGPNGYYQAPGQPGGRPPLSPIGPGFGYEDDPGSPGGGGSTTVSPDKGHEASAVLGLGLSTKSQPPSAANSSSAAPPADSHDGLPPQRQGSLPTEADAPVHEVPDEGLQGDNHLSQGSPGAGAEEEEVIGEEPEPPPPGQPGPGLHFSAERRAQLEALAKVRVPPVEEQRRLFVKHHNKHVAAFNQHYAKYKGDVSKVATFSRMKRV